MITSLPTIVELIAAGILVVALFEYFIIAYASKQSPCPTYSVNYKLCVSNYK